MAENEKTKQVNKLDPIGKFIPGTGQSATFRLTPRQTRYFAFHSALVGIDLSGTTT